MHQQFSVSHRISIENVSLFIRTDMDARHKKLALFNITIRIFKVYRAQPQALYLRTEKLNPRLICVKDKIVVAGFFVLRYYFMSIIFACHNIFSFPFCASYFITLKRACQAQTNRRFLPFFSALAPVFRAYLRKQRAEERIDFVINCCRLFALSRFFLCFFS